MHSHIVLSLGLLVAPALATRNFFKGPSHCTNPVYLVKNGLCIARAKINIEQCSSFLRATVTPCPSTSTKTVTVDSTAPAVTEFAPTSTTETTTISETTVERPIISETLTTTTTDTISTFTQTVTITATTTVTPAPIKRAAKRAAETFRPLPPAPSFTELYARAASASASPGCQPTTALSTAGPALCREQQGYSSACSCFASASTTTLAPNTVTVTKTETENITPTQVVSTTVTVLTSVTETTTIVEPTTTTFLDTLTVQGVASTTLTVTTTTTTILPPACTAYNFAIQGGPYDGQFITGETPTNPDSYSFVFATKTRGDALPYVLRSDGRVFGNNLSVWTLTAHQVSFVLQMTNSEPRSYDLLCSITPGTTSLAGAVGTLSCTLNGEPRPFVMCNNVWPGMILTERDRGNCKRIALAAIPVPCP